KLGLSFLLLHGSTVNEHANRLFEIQQPERQLKVVDIKEFGLLSECPRVFVVGVQHDDVCARVISENVRQHQRNGARFPGPGCGKHCEILWQQLVDQYKNRPTSVMVEASNADVGSQWSHINRVQIGCRRGSDRSARNWMTGYAAMELARPLG